MIILHNHARDNSDYLAYKTSVQVVSNQSIFHKIRVQRSLISQPALWASCSQDVLAGRSFLLAQKFSMFYGAPVNQFQRKDKFH